MKIEEELFQEAMKAGHGSEAWQRWAAAEADLAALADKATEISQVDARHERLTEDRREDVMAIARARSQPRSYFPQAVLVLAAALVLVTAVWVIMAGRPAEVTPITATLPPAVKMPAVALPAIKALPRDEFAVVFAARAKATRERVLTGTRRSIGPAAKLVRDSRFESRASGLRVRLAERKQGWRTDAM